jgi:hypothetical protein
MHTHDITPILANEGARKEYQRSILASLREWERRRTEDPKATDWQLLGSVIARIEAEQS